MTFYLIGIDHKATSLGLRQDAYLRREEIKDFLSGLSRDAKILFTCNRVEIYAKAGDFIAVHKTVGLLRARFRPIFDNVYVRYGVSEVILHALRLACGLESQLKGEEQILSQLHSWIRQDGFGPSLLSLWCQVLSRARDIRSWSGLKQASIAAIVLEDITSRRELAGPAQILVVGTGKVARLFAKEPVPGVKLYFAARKKHSRARQLAQVSGGKAILFDQALALFLDVDAVVSATSSPHYLLGKEHFLKAALRRRSILYLYDLAVPGDVDPQVSGLKGVSLHTLEDLNGLFNKYNQRLKPNIARVEVLIKESAKAIREKLDAYSYQSGDAAKPPCFTAG